MSVVKELGYIGLGVSDIDAWETYAKEILGFEAFREPGDERLYLRLDYHHHRFALYPSGDDQVVYFGFRVEDDIAFRDVQTLLSDNGYVFEVASAEEARDRRVLELLRLEDHMGFPVEIFHGPEILSHRPFHPGRPMHGKFVTDYENGFGHCNFRTVDAMATRKLALLLGFKGNVEYLASPDQNVLDTTYFMHCNKRDHSIAFKQADKNEVAHIMVQFEDPRDLGHSLDIINASEWDLREGLGMHSIDQMMTMYFETPSGWAFEFGWGGGSSTDETKYYAKDVFGH